MSVLHIVGQKCTLAASHAGIRITLVSRGEYADGTDRPMPRPLHYAFRYTRPSASVIMQKGNIFSQRIIDDWNKLPADVVNLAAL